MPQHDYVIADQTTPNFRSDLNNVLQAIVGLNSGSTAPATTYAYMLWLDTSTTPATLKQRDAGNTAWGVFAPNLLDEDDMASNSATQAPTQQSVKAFAKISKEYASTGQTITSGGLLTLAHGLGEEPKLVEYILQCTTADAGYAVGDRIITEMNSTAGASSRYNNARVDSTEINVRFSNATDCFAAGNKGTGNAETLTNSSWELYVRAFA